MTFRWWDSHAAQINSSIGNAHEREQLGVLTGFLSLFVVRACWVSGSSLALTLDFINDFWTVKLAVEIGIQVVSLVSHQGAEWPIGRRDTAIA